MDRVAEMSTDEAIEYLNYTGPVHKIPMVINQDAFDKFDKSMCQVCFK